MALSPYDIFNFHYWKNHFENKYQKKAIITKATSGGELYDILKADMFYRDVADLYAKGDIERYYIITPWKYIIKQYLRFAGIFLLFSLVQFNLFLTAVIPLLLVYAYKFYNFAKYSENMNVSSKKLIISMIAVFTIEMWLSAFIRYTLFGIIFV